MDIITRLNATLDRLEGSILRNSARVAESNARLEAAVASGDEVAAKEARSELSLAYSNIGNATLAIAKIAESIMPPKKDHTGAL
jgi:hypothetical protein